jgi:hypothetical protein
MIFDIHDRLGIMINPPIAPDGQEDILIISSVTVVTADVLFY